VNSIVIPSTPSLHAKPGGRWAVPDRFAALPPAAWLVLPLAASWPTWRWMAARLADGSDEPWGLVAIAALVLLVWREREAFSRAPRLPALAASTGLLAAAAALPLPALARATLAVAASVAMLSALRRREQPILAYAGLALLSLPLLASLQFYGGFPLRVITAEATRGLLALGGVDTVREGTALLVHGRLVMVDAPCAGIHMGWAAYFAACGAAAWLRLPDGVFLRRLPLVGVAVLAGNVLRNTVLVLGESRDGGLAPALHAAIGVAAFALVCGFVLHHVGRPVRRPEEIRHASRR
jgi:exosortase/archaeosortase family protein